MGLFSQFWVPLCGAAQKALHRVRDTTIEVPLANQKPRPVGGPDEAFMSGSPLRHPDNSLRLDVLQRAWTT